MVEANKQLIHFDISASTKKLSTGFITKLTEWFCESKGYGGW